MEDEEGYMVLKPRSWNEASTQLQRTEGVPEWSKQSKISVGILGAICGFLGLALIGFTGLSLIESYNLRITSGQGFWFLSKETVVDPDGTKNGTRILQGPKRRESSTCTEDIVAHLCEPFTGNSKCKLCPINWTSLKEKCYWVSKDKKNWLWAYSDCTRKRAQMLVVLDLEEMVFIQNIIEENYPVWIGLNFTSRSKNWTWLDQSVLDQNLPMTTAHLCAPVAGAVSPEGAFNFGVKDKG
ncbi:killer cell lectin-like receptor subfamily F member 1 [Heteronotia binoei]|uniref:killer cell lectin-like receptor subfamily F member 1 n=1 Tax=Heteronotia binoei TaxID=13085 RepID=UPI00292F33AC|nr:killer cell lectin-like receptor subfamily F member 1 [Heteronotia binoei]